MYTPNYIVCLSSLLSYLSAKRGERWMSYESEYLCRELNNTTMFFRV